MMLTTNFTSLKLLATTQFQFGSFISRVSKQLYHRKSIFSKKNVFLRCVQRWRWEKQKKNTEKEHVAWAFTFNDSFNSILSKPVDSWCHKTSCAPCTEQWRWPCLNAAGFGKEAIIKECLCKQDNGSLWHIQTECFDGLSRTYKDKGQSPWKIIL